MEAALMFSYRWAVGFAAALQEVFRLIEAHQRAFKALDDWGGC